RPPAPAPAQLLSVWNVYAMVLAALVASWVGQVRLSRLPFTGLGLPGGARAGIDLVAGAVVGVGVLGAVVLALVAFGWLTWESDGSRGSAVVAAASLAGVLFGAAFVEELLFRGYPFQVIERRFGGVAALATTSLLFAAAHGANPNTGALPLVNIGLAGVLLGLAYWRTRSLWFATGVHLGWNWIMAVSELSVSGLDFGMPGFDPVLSGPDLLTGGAFGPEGGLLVSLASVATIVWMWRWRPKGESLSPRPTPVELERNR
ncbi:MAG: CPBP family intramembrane glutamic endopeptidase, partial [Gemmatimonadota bacterium]|nr:CPBP family intramembrane glutamic endopeptidase [Gemmatimonadota bacterium]